MSKAPINTIPPDKPLTPKQEMFCREYLIDLNATQAAIRAGYSVKTAKLIGYENLTKPYIHEYIQKLKKERVKEVKIDANYVLTQAKKLHERCMQEDEFHPSGAAKALELIGKHVDVAAFKDRVEHSGEDGGPIKITGINIGFVDPNKGKDAAEVDEVDADRDDDTEFIDEDSM